MEYNHKLQVEAISYGTVIDHIPAKMGFKLFSLFELTKTNQRIIICLNLPSNHLGKKDLIKIENTLLTPEQVNKLAMYAPYATINHIKNYKVWEKLLTTLPNQIDAVLICPNSNCISNKEPVSSSFIIKQRYNEIILTCKYCEKTFDRYTVINNM